VRNLVALITFAVWSTVLVLAQQTSGVRTDFPAEVWDLVNIVAVGHEEVSGSYTVSVSGAITLPNIGEVIVRQKTSAEIELIIRDRLSSIGVKNPQTQITLQWPIAITGYVNQPGGYAVSPGTSVAALLERAHGTIRGTDYSIAIVRLVGEKLETIRSVAKRDLLERGDIVVVGPSRGLWR
jgi:protein involved in polysaccharide export with SLBB domain